MSEEEKNLTENSTEEPQNQEVSNEETPEENVDQPEVEAEASPEVEENPEPEQEPAESQEPDPEPIDLSPAEEEDPDDWWETEEFACRNLFDLNSIRIAHAKNWDEGYQDTALMYREPLWVPQGTSQIQGTELSFTMEIYTDEVLYEEEDDFGIPF